MFAVKIFSDLDIQTLTSKLQGVKSFAPSGPLKTAI